MARLRQLLIFLGVLLVLCLAGIVLFLYTLDLNTYRRQLEDTLAGALSLPVQLGAVQLTFEPGPAFSFSDLSIGTGDGDEDILRAERILFKLDLWPLLTGKIALRDILLDRPRFRHRLSSVPPDSVPLSPPSQPFRPLLDVGFLSQGRIQSLTIVQGHFELLDQRQPDRLIVSTLNNVDFYLENLAPGQTSQLALKAQWLYGGNAADLSMTGAIGLPADLESWRKTSIQVTLNLADLDAGLITAFFPASAPSLTASGQTSLLLESSGSFNEGMDFRLRLWGDDFSLQSPAVGIRGKDLFPLALSGHWRPQKGIHRLSDLRLDGGNLHLQGESSLETVEDGLRLQTSWSSKPLPITAINAFFPESEKGARFANLLQEGSVELTSLTAAIQPDNTRPTGHRFLVQNARLILRDGRLRLLPNLDMTKLAGQVDLRDDELALEVTANTAGHAFRLEGTLRSPFTANRQLSLRAAGAIDVPWLKSALPALREHPASLQGVVPFTVSAQGPWEDLDLDVDATLDSLAIDWPRILSKSSETDSRLTLLLRRRPDSLTLVQGSLSFPTLQVGLSGDLSPQEEHPYHLDIHGKAQDLAELPNYLPFLKWLAPRGRATFDLQLAGDRQGIAFRGGEAVVQDVGVHLTRVIPDLTAINGRIRLHPDHAIGENLALKLGESALVADARLHRYDAFQLQVDVRGEAVRAQDIIFPSEVAVLHDIVGRLHFDREGMEFDPVDVRLERGTEAQVRGRIHWKGQPSVRLDIASPIANIDEVIALWQDDSSRKEDEKDRAEQRSVKRSRVQVDIKARAAQGSIGNLRFTNAEGDIWLKDHVLGISPIRFHAKDGYGIGQVLVDSSQGSPSLLRISGHLENFDAATIYQEMLEHRGLVTGTMRGDFYLQGRLGKDFLTTSLGGINLEIKKGVLRQLKTLSRVFSLLNVSQIFSLQLPDMAEEGMPFNTLHTSISLDQGVLSTEDLFIDSNAMNLSLVGSYSLIDDQLNLTLGIKPLGTVDKIVSSIPLAGWLLTGEDKALVTAQFKVEGSGKDPEVSAIPITSVSETVLGIFKRTLGLPGKVITDLESLGTGETKGDRNEE